MQSAIVKAVMKSVRNLMLKVTRKSRPVYRQMELLLPGSHITREETGFLREIRHLRERLTASRT
jgi:hypothetical protein